MSRSPVRRRRAVLVFAIAILPWAAVSRVGERSPASSDAVPNTSATVEAFTSMPVVASDRHITLLFVRRADRTQTAATTPVGVALARRSPPRSARKGTIMTTADAVREHALALARTSVDRDEAVRELEALCGGRRVAVVRARQQVLSSPEGSEEPATGRAVELLDELLGRLPA